ncbi:MAG TPA: 16S rRNA (cytosine(1402)-N(4))-methyltransferase RsmH [bacterium]|nr:16S rRNA (cytosine(1402)-N(4))-methyltransferase RsmH [bacterium]
MKGAYHDAVMVDEALHYLGPGPGRVIVDGTLGGGSHAEAVLNWAGADGGRVKLVLGIDQDPEAVAEAGKRLGGFGERIRIKRAGFEELPALLEEEGLEKVDGILLDLGASRHQLVDARRGFSLRGESALDMRMDPDAPESAAELLLRLSGKELKKLIWEYGEERHAGRIARAIVARREEGRPVKTTEELAALVEKLVPAKERGRLHPATRTFMAIRIAVNRELDKLDEALAAMPGVLRAGGRAVVISYHSLEDRRVKQAFQKGAKGCVCPPGLPCCVCGHKPVYRILTRKPLRPAEAEVGKNPAARSARLRAVERLEESA